MSNSTLNPAITADAHAASNPEATVAGLRSALRNIATYAPYAALDRGPKKAYVERVEQL